MKYVKYVFFSINSRFINLVSKRSNNSLSLSEYSKLHHQYEQENGYALQSELTGVLKGLGFEEEEYQLPINYMSKSWINICSITSDNNIAIHRFEFVFLKIYA